MQLNDGRFTNLIHLSMLAELDLICYFPGTIIFLHGLGGDSIAWERKLNDLFSNENKENSNQIKIFCPESPKIPISRFNHTPMNAWFNVYDAYCSDNQGICNAATVNKIPITSEDSDL